MGVTENFTREWLLTTSSIHRAERLGQGREDSIGLTCSTPVLRQDKTQRSQTDRVTLLARHDAPARQPTRIVHDPRQINILKPSCYIFKNRVYTIYTHVCSNSSHRRRVTMRRQRYRQLLCRLPPARHRRKSRIFNSTLGYPGEGPGSVLTRTGSSQQQSDEQTRTPPPPSDTPPPSCPGPGEAHQQHQHLQPPLQMGTVRHGHTRRKRCRKSSRRGRYKKKMCSWSQGAVAAWRKRHRDAIWRRLMRM